MIGQTIRLAGPSQRARAKELIDIDLLQQILRLDEATGRLFWRERPEHMFGGPNPKAACRSWNVLRAGKEALTADDSHGYRKGSLFNRTLKAHRIVFALANGRWPIDEIDHIDGNIQNNLPSNLRECDRTGNVRNAKAKRIGSKSSRFKGVYKTPKGRWIVQCKGDDDRYYRGTYATEMEAALAYDEVAARLHGQFAKGNFA